MQSRKDWRKAFGSLRTESRELAVADRMFFSFMQRLSSVYCRLSTDMNMSGEPLRVAEWPVRSSFLNAAKRWMIWHRVRLNGNSSMSN
jgi:hypothetical protein